MEYGLEGVVVAETTLSRVDGAGGNLIIAGTQLCDLVKLSYEDVATRLGHQTTRWGELRLDTYQGLQAHSRELHNRPPLDALTLGLSLLPGNSSSAELIAGLPVILAMTKNGERTPAPDPSLGQVEDLLRMFHLGKSSQKEVSALSTYLVTVSEHGMNASTFTCRVVASTQASQRAASLAALSALSGPLHGGAPGPVLDLLDELANCQNPEAHLKAKVQAGERLMGFGHRVYRARDPRAEVLQKAVMELKDSQHLKHAVEMERLAQHVLAEAKPGRTLLANVEFYTAVLLHELGFEREWFTPLFATGRILGWMAHFQEQQKRGRLMRPKARYVGTIPAEMSVAEVAEVAPA